MKIDKEAADSLKLAVRRLFETPDGQLLIEFLEECSGRFNPTYNPENQTTIILEAGRRQLVASLHNLNRLTSEQVVEYYRKDSL